MCNMHCVVVVFACGSGSCIYVMVVVVVLDHNVMACSIQPPRLASAQGHMHAHTLLLMIRWPGMGTSPVCTPSACLSRLRLYVPSVASVGITSSVDLQPQPLIWAMAQVR